MSALRPGDLREKVDVQTSSGTRQPGGGTAKAWATVLTGILAKIEPLSGGEAFRQGMANNTQLYRVTIRWRAGVTPANRLIWRGTPLNIRTCGNPDLRREALVMMVESGVAEP